MKKSQTTDIRTSKAMCFLLRHHPEAAGLYVDDSGWCDVESFLGGLAKINHVITRDELEEIVALDEKGRFSFDAAKIRIRANHGHSIARVIPDMEETAPPRFLWHGTSRRFLSSIKSEGLKKMRRNFVHLSSSEESAYTVGVRHEGATIMLKIDSGRMHADGWKFRHSESDVWLVDAVPVTYITNLRGFEE